LVAIEVGYTSGLAAKRETAPVERPLEGRGAVGSKIDRARGNLTIGIVGDAHGQIVPIDQAHIVPIKTVSGTESPLGDGRRRNTSSSVRVALETSIASAIGARIRAGVGGEVAVTTTPNAARLPVVRNSESAFGVRSSFPAGLDLGRSRSDIEIGKHSRPDSERAGVIDGEGAS